MSPNKAQRLEIAAAIAPSIRGASDKALVRRFHIVKADDPTWTPISQATGKEALRGLAKLHEIEHAVAEGVRPKEIVCEVCGNLVPVCGSGQLPKRCAETCAVFCSGGCKKKAPSSAFVPGAVRRRQGRPWACADCTPALRKPKRKLRPAEVAESQRKRLAATTYKQRSESSRKGRIGRPKRAPECHPDRPHLARGLCAACYQAIQKCRLAPLSPRE